MKILWLILGVAIGMFCSQVFLKSPESFECPKCKESTVSNTIEKCEVPSQPKTVIMTPQIPSITPTEAPVPSTNSRAEWKISAIEKIVSLTPEEKEKLRENYNQPQPDQLENIIGPERAEAYKNHVKQTFSKVEEENIQREVYYLSRKLNLDAMQEGQFFGLYRDLNEEVERRLEAENFKEQGVKRMIRANQIEDQLLRERLKNVLSEQQYKEWALLQSDSSGQDLEMFHSK